MYIIVHNSIYNQYDYLTPNKWNTFSTDTLEGSTGFWQKKFRGGFHPKSKHKIKNK